MLSRTLGPEIGGSVGILFYFANIVCSGLYVTACVEGLVTNIGPDGAFADVSIDVDMRVVMMRYFIGSVTLNLHVCLSAC